MFQIQKRDKNPPDGHEQLMPAFHTKQTYDTLPHNLDPSISDDDLIEDTLAEKFGDGYYLIIEIRGGRGNIKCIWKGKAQGEKLWTGRDKLIDQDEVEPMEED